MLEEEGVTVQLPGRHMTEYHDARDAPDGGITTLIAAGTLPAIRAGVRKVRWQFPEAKIEVEARTTDADVTAGPDVIYCGHRGNGVTSGALVGYCAISWTQPSAGAAGGVGSPRCRPTSGHDTEGRWAAEVPAVAGPSALSRLNGSRSSGR